MSPMLGKEELLRPGATSDGSVHSDTEANSPPASDGNSIAVNPSDTDHFEDLFSSDDEQSVTGENESLNQDTSRSSSHGSWTSLDTDTSRSGSQGSWTSSDTTSISLSDYLSANEAGEGNIQEDVCYRLLWWMANQDWWDRLVHLSETA